MSWNPAASVPCGFTAEGLPVGLQIVGKRFDDLGVLQASAAFEQIQPWAAKRPALSYLSTRRARPGPASLIALHRGRCRPLCLPRSTTGISAYPRDILSR